MCTAGLSNERPNIDSMTIWCESPMPSWKRPLVASQAVIACCAMACGCLGYVGTTAVPSVRLGAARPAIADAVIASIPKMFAIQAVLKPCAAADSALRTTSSTVAPPMLSPMSMTPASHCVPMLSHRTARTARATCRPARSYPWWRRRGAECRPVARRTPARAGRRRRRIDVTDSRLPRSLPSWPE